MSSAVLAPANSLRVLVGDDQTGVLEAVRLVLKGEGHSCVTVDNPAAVLKSAMTDEFDLILIDLNYARDTTSGREGLDLLAALHKSGVETPIIVMTAWGSVELAVEAMRRGACDFIQKPWDNARLLDTIRKQADEAAERVARRKKARSEVEIARNVQQTLLPRVKSELATARYAACCTPAGHVGGDYYDFIEMANGTMGFVLADVAGKGIAAALLMAHLQASLRSRTSHVSVDIPEVLQEVNRAFYESTPVEHYATMVFGRYDDTTRQFHYVNAGHLAPMLVRASGELERLDVTTTPIGLLEQWHSRETTVDLRRGDTLLLFSDGVVENGFEDGKEFGEEALAELAIEKRHLDVPRFLSELSDHVLRYSTTQHDDLTLLAVRGV